MGRLFSFVSVFLIVIGAAGIAHAERKNDLQREKLKGKVKTVTEYEYAAVEDSKVPEKGALKVKAVCRYNENGNRIDYITYSEDGKVQSKSEYNYNDNSTLKDVKRYRGDGGLNVTTTYKYDMLGNESEETNTDP